MLCGCPPGSEQEMTKELNEKVIAFRTAMSVMKSMLKSGVITDAEYAQIEAIIAENYGLSSSTIFR